MMRWSLNKKIWESCRFTSTDIDASLTNGHTGATCLFHNVGTTVPETVTRHVYGLIVQNQAATFNNVHVFHVPDGATGTQWFLKWTHLGAAGDHHAYPNAVFKIPETPDPMKPLFPLEGGSKLFGSSATASVSITVMYWDDILTGIEDT